MADASFAAPRSPSPTPSPGTPSRAVDRLSFALIGVVSVAALGLLAWLLLVRKGDPTAALDLRFMPAVNASLNAVAASFLVAGYVFIRRKNPRLHQLCMVSAFLASTLFLVGYLAYHYVHGDTKYAGEGLLRLVYFAVLISHILLSMFVVPMALLTFYFSFRRQLARHRRIARWTLPIWLYVSVTGVVVFFMLRGSAPAVP